jgi:hypothetical protein
MKTNDPRLTSFVLGELNAEDSRAVKDAMNTNKAIAEEIAAIESMVSLVSKGFASDHLKLTAQQRGKIFSSGAVSKVDSIVSFNSARSPKLTWWSAGIAAAAAITLIFTIGPSSNNRQMVDFNNFSASELTERMGLNTKVWNQTGTIVSPASGSKLEHALAHSPKEYKAVSIEKCRTSIAQGSDQVSPLPFLKTQSQNSSLLPLTSGIASWEWIRTASLNGSEIQPSMVRTEELINAMDLPVEPTYSTKGLASALELVPCPWDSNALLANIHFENTNAVVLEKVSAGIQVSETVENFQILGYQAGDKSSLDAPEILNMEPGYKHSALVLLQFAQAPTSDTSLITLHLSVNGTRESIRYSFDETFRPIPSKRSIMATSIAAWAKKYEDGTPRGPWFADTSDSLRRFTFASENASVQQLAKVLLGQE